MYYWEGFSIGTSDESVQAEEAEVPEVVSYVAP